MIEVAVSGPACLSTGAITYLKKKNNRARTEGSETDMDIEEKGCVVREKRHNRHPEDKSGCDACVVSAC